MKLYILFFRLLFCFVPPLQAKEVNFLEVNSATEWETVLNAASESEKIIFVDFCADWCAYCRKMEAEVFTDDALADYHNEHFVNVKIDSDSEFGLDFTNIYELEVYPTCFYLHPDNYIIKTLEGFTDVEELLNKSIEAAVFKYRYPELQRLYESADITNSELAEYILMTAIVDSRQLNELLLTFNDMSFNNEDFADEFILQVIAEYFYDISNPMVLRVLDMHEEIKQKSRSDFFEFYQYVFDKNMELAIKDVSESRLLKILNTLDVYLPEEELLSGEYHVWSMYFEETRQYDELLVHILYYAERAIEPSEVYYDAAYNILETSWDDANMLKLALELMEEYRRETDSDFDYYLTSGVVYAYLGELDTAEKYLEKAKKNAPDSESVKSVEEIIVFISQLH